MVGRRLAVSAAVALAMGAMLAGTGPGWAQDGTPKADPGAPPLAEKEAPPPEPPPINPVANEAGKHVGIFNVQIENDLFTLTNSDQHYTHGTRLGFMSLAEDIPSWVRKAASYVPMFNRHGTRRYSLTLGQNLYTPDDITNPTVIDDDRPYAGWLYGGVGLVADDGRRLDSLELNLGMVGPAALGRPTQTTVHQVVGSPKPRGWSHQLKNEPGLVLYYERASRALFELEHAGLGFDVSPHIGGAVGNVFTHANAGVTFRFGDDLPNDYGPPLIRPSLPGSGFFLSDDSIGWYVFAGLGGRAVARNIFLDGNTFTTSHSVHKKHFVGDMQLGAAITISDVRIVFTHVIRSKEFDGQENDFDQFGGITFSVRY